MPTIAIIVPCYNEAQRLPRQQFLAFAQEHPEASLLFVNDGSTDGTGKILEDLKASSPTIDVLHLTSNKGKGEAVRQGLLEAIRLYPGSFAGYLDADLSTSLQEFYSLYQLAQTSGADLILGSRIKKLDTTIKRSFARHLIGRTIATLIDYRYQLGVYDTQCGAKLFKTSIIEKAVQQPFQTRWFFDVELLHRLRQGDVSFKGKEIALNEWHNVRQSKLNVLSFPTVMRELFTLLTISRK